MQNQTNGNATCSANETDFNFTTANFITIAPIKGWNKLGEPSVLEVGVVEAVKLGKCKGLSDFDIVL